MASIDFTEGQTVIPASWANGVDYTVYERFLVGSATYNPPNLADGAGTLTEVTVTGAAMGDFAIASFSLDTSGLMLTACVTAANTVTVRIQNETGMSIDKFEGTLSVLVIKQTAPT